MEVGGSLGTEVPGVDVLAKDVGVFADTLFPLLEPASSFWTPMVIVPHQVEQSAARSYHLFAGILIFLRSCLSWSFSRL